MTSSPLDVKSLLMQSEQNTTYDSYSLDGDAEPNMNPSTQNGIMDKPNQTINQVFLGGTGAFEVDTEVLSINGKTQNDSSEPGTVSTSADEISSSLKSATNTSPSLKVSEKIKNEIENFQEENQKIVQSKRKKSRRQNYEVEAIIDKKIGEDGIWKYCVKWSGWPSDANTWEPLVNFSACLPLVQKYESELLMKSAVENRMQPNEDQID